MFPLDFQGRIKLDAVEPTAVDSILSSVEQALKNAQATDISHTGSKISFRGGFFRFVNGWNILLPVGSGEIEVLAGTPGIVRYNFSCLEMLVVTAVLVTLFCIMLGSFNGFIVMWLGLFGGNYLLGMIRLPGFIKRAVQRKEIGDGRVPPIA